MVAALGPAQAIVAVVVAVFLLLSYVLVLADRAVQWSKGLPFGLGNLFVSLIGGAVVLVRVLAAGVEGYMIWTQRVTATAFHWAVGEVIDLKFRVFYTFWNVLLWQVNSIILPFQANADQAIRGLQHYTFDELIPFERNADAAIRGLQHYTFDELIPFERVADQAIRGLQHYTFDELIPFERGADQAIRALQHYTFDDILPRLGSDEVAVQRAFENLRGNLGQLEGRIGEIEQTLRLVLPLATLAALGAVAIENLRNVARDPCYCLHSGDLSDLPFRVEALEELGT